MKNIYLLILLIPITVGAAPIQFTATWEPSIEYTDGSPLTDIGGYNFYCSLDGVTFNRVGLPANPTASTGIIPNCMVTEYGEVWLAMTVYDSFGAESAYSNIVKKNYPIPKVPAAPTGFVVSDP